MNERKQIYKILVIDDRPDNVYYLQSRLQKEDFEVITAFSGQEGLERTVKEKPDLILLDIMMPDIDGYDVCRTLLKKEDTSKIPIILVTAKVEAKDVEEGLKAGAFDYIKKPFDKVELIARINSALRFAELQKRFIQNQRYEMFEATVVTANHEIKQPLTLMALAISAIKRELNQSIINKDVLSQKLEYIDSGVKRITTLLNKLNSLKNPGTAAYTKKIKMLDINEDDKDLINLNN